MQYTLLNVYPKSVEIHDQHSITLTQLIKPCNRVLRSTLEVTHFVFLSRTKTRTFRLRGGGMLYVAPKVTLEGTYTSSEHLERQGAVAKLNPFLEWKALDFMDKLGQSLS